MDFSETINDIATYLQSNIYVTLGLVLVFLLLIFRKPKIFIAIAVIVFLLYGVLFMISDVTETGDEHRQEMVKEKILKD
ncbi:MAG: hypothetical protein HZC48_01270 [Nitrospirae bacterium]|nr:hypothetical protein [Nitrospirota bacterium]